MAKKHTAFVICDIHNSGVFIDRVTSTKEINMQRLIKYYEEKQGYDWDRDSITLVEDFECPTVDLDTEGV